jgi:tripartite-type tricarboxylate transporter receptor subunit TctC
MVETRLPRLRLLLLTLTALSMGSAAQGDDQYPNRPIKVVVPFGPGSATDIVIRIVGEAMRPILGQAVLVENKPGAFGIIAIEEMAHARPDGYTLQIGNSGTNALAPIIYKKKFKIDYDQDVTLVTALSEVPLVLAATTKDFPPTTYAEFIAYAKAHPGEVRYASVGTGSNNHYNMEAFAKWAGIELAHLPNKGGGGAMTNDLLTGNAHVGLVNAASALGVIKAGEVRALAIMADRRVPELPDVPTLLELGYSNAKGLWSALYAPSATPRDVIETVFRTTTQALRSETVQSAFGKQMIKAIPSTSLEDAQAFNQAERAYWKKVTEVVKIELPD